ncbi:D-tagatose 3-epimerase [Caulifigura coniformis]|uniref:D-tagatose 3-epimerase n=1 Tax=Caulifigura coniformis TaxID=2527983 RepID=A0A517SCX7_9PLAN|nr:sugar phosphate isomerase/epimerase family protein [Caulifigura coniformis]QDT53979.1 D-tagatose 3-epimerase [Caulifigura coniformis]
MKYALCQELFENRSWEDQCRTMARLGYTGAEVAPFSICAHPRDLLPTDRHRLRETAETHGVEIIGLHWLLAKTAGFHLTADDPRIRAATADYLSLLADLCADLGGTIMVFGSPAQRSLREGLSREEGIDRAVETFKACMPRLGERGVTLCLEPLTTKETNFINTCADAAEIIERVNLPAIALHQDVKAMLGEETPIPALIDRFKSITKHFHVNDSNLLGPGMGETDYLPIFRALRDSRYDGWISVEVFDYSPGADHIARESIEYMHRINAQLDGASA